MPISYEGTGPTDDSDLATRAYVESLTDDHMDQAEVDELIDTGLLNYALKTEVDALDANLATVAEVDAGDDTKLKWIDRNTANGWAGLDSTGRIDVSRVALTSTQRWPVPFYTPAAYHTSAKAVPYGSEVTLYTASVADPGIDYKLLVSGRMEAKPLTGGNVTIRVRVGSSSGTVVASGTPSGDNFTYGRSEFLNPSTSSVGSGWEQTSGGEGNGHYASDGTKAYWVIDGNYSNRFDLCRKINDFAVSTSDYQELTYKMAGPHDFPALDGQPGYTLFYGRVASDWTRYIVVKVSTGRILWGGRGEAKMYYNNGAGEVLVGTATGLDLDTDDIIRLECGDYATKNKRKIRLYYNGSLKITWNDVSSSAMGTSYRGWGWGGIAGYSGLLPSFTTTQSRPAPFTYAQLRDPAAPWADTDARAPTTLVPADLDDQDLLTGAKTLYVTAECDTPGGTAYVTTNYPKLHIVPLPN